MEKHFHLKSKEIPIYGGKLVIILSNDADRINKILDDSVAVRETIHAHAILGDYKNFLAYFTIFNFNGEESVTHGTIAHEAAHIVNYLFHNRGIHPDLHNDEPQTYLTGWIVDEIYRFIDNKGFKVSYK